MSNRDRCLAAALRLFNAHGSGEVTTNQIAEAAGVSVGNLYYHFRSKEDIVLALFDAMDTAWRTRLVPRSTEQVTWSDLAALMAEHFSIVWSYRFFYREQVALRRRDAGLARKWLEANQRGRADMASLLQLYAHTHRAPPLAVPALERLTDACWIIADFWLVHREMRTGKVHHGDLEEGLALFAAVMRPLLEAEITASKAGAS